jgi:fermentation-respiration switch protein FrsA (DUF1100 family)
MSMMPSAGFIKLILMLPGIGYLVLILYALVFANRMVFPAPLPGYSDSPDIIKLRGADSGNVVSLLYLENPGSPYLMYYHHGNGEDLQSCLPRLEALKEAGYSVLAWDYPGYGTSTGKPTEKSVQEFALQIWETIPERFGYAHDKVILYGRSVGGGPALWLASQQKAAGVIAEGTFTSIFRVGLPVNILPWDIFDNLKYVQSLKCPSLFIHGTNDQTVPFSHAVELHKKATGPKFFTWINDGQHNDIIEAYSDTYYTSLNRFREFISQI